MESIPGNDEAAWIGYLRFAMEFEGERHSSDSYDAQLKASWRELLSALPALRADAK